MNPKPGLFVVAFIPQLTNPDRGAVPMQMLVYGAGLTLMAAGLSILAMGRRT